MRLRVELTIDENMSLDCRMIDEPRAQNPYQLYTDTRRRSSLYDFSLTEDHQQKQPTSFIQAGSLVNPDDHEQPKDELDGHSSCKFQPLHSC